MKPVARVRRRLVLVGTAAVLSVIHASCVLIPASKRALSVLKNRTAIPAVADFDPFATLEAMLQPGDDTGRWSDAKAARIQGYVVAVRQAGIESANRFSLTRRDTHIEVALRRDAPPKERMILEVTPPMRDWAKARGVDWSAETLERTLPGRMARFEGWLLFDSEHGDESENTYPGGDDNWRATAWEGHPITAITIVDGPGAAAPLGAAGGFSNDRKYSGPVRDTRTLATQGE